VSDKYVLTVDAGSSGGRALVFDLRGNVLSSVARGWTYDVPGDVAPMGKEFDPDVFWGYICQLVSQAIREAAVTPADIIAVSSASQRQGVVFLDKEGREVYGGPNTDLRAIVEGFSIDGKHGSEVYAITGHTPSLMLSPAKLHWFKANRLDAYERISKAISISDWVAYRLSGQVVGETSCISSIGLMDVCELSGSDRLEELLELPEGICPTIAPAGTRVGTVTTKAAEQLGLAPDTSVVVGGADSQCALLGMGVTDEAQVGIVAGWSGSIQMVTSRPIIDSEGRVWTTCHVLPQKWILESNAQQSGGSYAWLKETLFGESAGDTGSYASMDAMAQESPPGAGGVIAFIGPMLMDMRRMKLSLGGFVFPVTPSITDVRRGHLIRAALENLAFAFKANCLQLEEIAGMKISDVKIGGGLAQSECLVQILADVLDRPVTAFDVRHVTSWGAAMCAAVGAGVYRDFGEAVKAMGPRSKVVEPGPDSAQQYVGLYARWVSVADWLDKLGDIIA
jgi:sugar (pentulose or hexulose) kinase